MEHGNGLLSLGNQKALSFSSDVGVQAVAWQAPATYTEASAGSGPAVIISNNNDAGVEEKENVVCLKEHDYIGLSSPVKPLPDPKSQNELSLPETDLHLGLGLALGPSKNSTLREDSEKTASFPLTQKEEAAKTVLEPPNYAFADIGHSVQKPWSNAGSFKPVTSENLKSATSAREFQSPNASTHVQDRGEGAARVSNTFYGVHSAALKNGIKRGYTEAMNETARFNMATEMHPAVAVAVKNGDSDARALPKHSLGAFMPNWAPSKPTLPAHWQGGLEQSSVLSFSSNKQTPVKATSRGEKPVPDLAPSAYKPRDTSEAGEELATNEPPPSKGQVVGWPPIRSYRKHTLAKPTEMFVKVNMDGMTVGRKVDLNAHNSYEGLLSALEEMFQPSSNGGQGAASGRENHPSDAKHFKLLHGSDFVLTYEDQDGDWMLVGDVPWSMFVNMVRRLRITRGSEATGLAPGRHDKIK